MVELRDPFLWQVASRMLLRSTKAIIFGLLHVSIHLQVFWAWSQMANLSHGAKQLLATFTPEVDRALSTQPSQRVAADIQIIQNVLAELPIARHLPPEALRIFSRACMYEVLHEDMVRESQACSQIPSLDAKAAKAPNHVCHDKRIRFVGT
jgi:hypothetical protein